MEQEQRTIWMRVGMSYTGTKEEIEKILSGDAVPDLNLALKNGTASVDGETYIPAYVVEEYNAEEGTDFTAYDIEWNL